MTVDLAAVEEVTQALVQTLDCLEVIMCPAKAFQEALV
jgi:hypothetical protein